MHICIGARVTALLVFGAGVEPPINRRPTSSVLRKPANGQTRPSDRGDVFTVHDSSTPLFKHLPCGINHDSALQPSIFVGCPRVCGRVFVHPPCNSAVTEGNMLEPAYPLSSWNQPPAEKAPAPPVELAWNALQSCLVTADCHGTLIVPMPLPDPKLNVKIELSPQLLYWSARRQWMWHKKWALPSLTVRVSRDPADPADSTANMADATSESFHIMVTAGTLRDAEPVLHNQGLGGVCQRSVLLPPGSHGVEVSFTRLLFQQTSFNVGNHPFRLMVSILAAPKADHKRKGLVPLACYCSDPVLVDARKRSKGERPDAKDDDVRLMQRSRPALNLSGQGPENDMSHPSQQHSQKLPHHLSPDSIPPPQGASDARLGSWISGMLSGWGGGSQTSDISAVASKNPALMDASGDAFCEVRADGVIINFLSSTVFGYLPSELLGRSILTVCHPDDHAGLLQTLQALLVLHAGCGQFNPQHNARDSLKNGQVAGSVPRSVRVLHRIVAGLGQGSDSSGLGGLRRPETITADTILTMNRSSLPVGMIPQTIIMCSRCALPILADPTNFSFQVLPSLAL